MMKHRMNATFRQGKMVINSTNMELLSLHVTSVNLKQLFSSISYSTRKLSMMVYGIFRCGASLYLPVSACLPVTVFHLKVSKPLLPSQQGVNGESHIRPC